MQSQITSKLLTMSIQINAPLDIPAINIPTQNRRPENMIVKKGSKISMLETVFKSIDDFICTSMDLPLKPFNDPKYIIGGKFAPVDELRPTACDVIIGTLPDSLDGVYIRNGPNPQFTPQGPYHILDGDGMLHTIKISKGKATFSSRYVKTYKYTVERDMGYAIFPSILSSFNGVMASISRCMLTTGRVLTGTFKFSPSTHGFGVANTSVAMICGHLYALCESDLPYEVNVTPEGDITTLERHKFSANNESNNFLRMCAHPKVDQETGEVFAFTYDMAAPPFLSLFRIDSNGRKQPNVPILSLESPTLIHDFAITKNYAILPDVQIGMSPMEMIHGRTPVIVDSKKLPRIGVISRHAKDDNEMLWIDVPGFNMLHSVNAWEEDGGDSIVMVASNMSPVEESLFSSTVELNNLCIEKIIINVKEKTVTRQPICSAGHDFGVINPAYAGKKNRYFYAVAKFESDREGLVKIDLTLPKDECKVAKHVYKPGCCTGEPFFVARDPNNLEASEEDDGYLLSYMLDENTQRSKFLVMDAKSPTLEIVAEVMLPCRVPSGFHGLFVPESKLN